MLRKEAKIELTSTTPTHVFVVTDQPFRLLDSPPELQRSVLKALAERVHADII